METKIFKIAVILLILTGIFSSCDNKIDDDEIVDNPETAILGKWKLVKTSWPMGGTSTDYTKCSVVFEFRPDSILKISGETVHSIPRFGSGTEVNEHFYSFVDGVPKASSQNLSQLRCQL
jgi:hypothetical protein